MTDTTEQQAVTVAQLQKLQDWLREPDHAENFGTQQILEWINRRPTHIIPSTLGKLALSRLASVSSASAEIDALRHKLWMVACHATGGGIPEIEGIERSTNDICVQITAFRNKMYQAGRDAASPEPVPATNQAGEVDGDDPCAGGQHCCCCGAGEPCCDCGLVMPSKACIGEKCWCGQPASKKVGEEILFDDPNPNRHNLTAYVCAEHYAQMMGPSGASQVGTIPAALATQPATSQEGEACARNLYLLQGDNARMAKALNQCREQFGFYAREHYAAGKNEKGDTNRKFAQIATDALTAVKAATPTPPTLSEDLRKALSDALVWHESEDKALSKQPSSSDGRWRRMQHQEQIASLADALARAQVKAS